MFDFFSFGELFLIAVVGMLVIGPQRLPEALRTLGLWFGRMRRSFTNVKAEIEREVGMDEVRRQLHNESIMAEMKRLEEDVRGTVQDTKNAIHPPAAGPAPTTTPETNAAADGAPPTAATDHADTANGKD